MATRQSLQFVFRLTVKELLVGGADGIVELWNVRARKRLHSFNFILGQVQAVAFSRNGGRVVAGTNEQDVYVWDTETEHILRHFRASDRADDPLAVGVLAFSPDGTKALAGNPDFTIRLWDVETGELKQTFKRKSEAVTAAAFPDGKRVLTGSADTKLRLWDVSAGKLLKTFGDHKGSITSVGFPASGEFMLSASADNTVKLWNVETFEAIRAFAGYRAVLSPSGSKILIAAQDSHTYTKTIQLWEASSGPRLWVSDGFRDGVTSLAFSHDGERLVVAGVGERDEVFNNISAGMLPYPSIRLLDAATGSTIQTFEQELDSSATPSAVLSRDGISLLAAYKCDAISKR